MRGLGEREGPPTSGAAAGRDGEVASGDEEVAAFSELSGGSTRIGADGGMQRVEARVDLEIGATDGGFLFFDCAEDPRSVGTRGVVS